MFDIHNVRISQNFDAFNTVCKREKIDFFLMLDVVKLLQSVVEEGEDFFDTRITFEKVKDKYLLKKVVKNKGHLLLDIGEDAFCIKEYAYFWIKEIYKIQVEKDEKYNAYLEKHDFYINTNLAKIKY